MGDAAGISDPEQVRAHLVAAATGDAASKWLEVYGKKKIWKLYLKQYEEETNLLLYLLLDTSESMSYASGQKSSPTPSTRYGRPVPPEYTEPSGSAPMICTRPPETSLR